VSSPDGPKRAVPGQRGHAASPRAPGTTRAPRERPWCAKAQTATGSSRAGPRGRSSQSHIIASAVGEGLGTGEQRRPLAVPGQDWARAPARGHEVWRVRWGARGAAVCRGLAASECHRAPQRGPSLGCSGNTKPAGTRGQSLCSRAELPAAGRSQAGGRVRRGPHEDTGRVPLRAGRAAAGPAAGAHSYSGSKVSTGRGDGAVARPLPMVGTRGATSHGGLSSSISPSRPPPCPRQGPCWGCWSCSGLPSPSFRVAVLLGEGFFPGIQCEFSSVPVCVTSSCAVPLPGGGSGSSSPHPRRQMRGFLSHNCTSPAPDPALSPARLSVLFAPADPDWARNPLAGGRGPAGTARGLGSPLLPGQPWPSALPWGPSSHPSPGFSRTHHATAFPSPCSHPRPSSLIPGTLHPSPSPAWWPLGLLRGAPVWQVLGVPDRPHGQPSLPPAGAGGGSWGPPRGAPAPSSALRGAPRHEHHLLHQP